MTGVGVPVPLNMMATQMASDLGSRAVLTPQVVEPPAEGKERLQFTFEDTAIPAAPCSCCCATTASRLTW